MKRIISILVIIFALSGCDTSDELSTSAVGIAGEWQWIRTDGGIAFHIHETPESTGKSVQLNLTGNNTFTLTENGAEVSSGNFNLSLKKSIYSGDQEPFIELPESAHAQSVVLNGIVQIISTDTLTISDNIYDGIGSTFTRIH